MRQDSSTPPIRTALYVRVSSEAQDAEDKVSLGEQTRDIEAYAAERGYSITHRYTDVESGASRTRPGFREMQGSAKAGAFDVVLAWRTDRLARSGSAMGDLLDSTKKHGIGIETVKEPFDRRYAGLMAEIAAIERQTFAERSVMGKWAQPGRAGYRRGSRSTVIAAQKMEGPSSMSSRPQSSTGCSTCTHMSASVCQPS